MNIYRAAFIGDNQRISEILADDPNQMHQILDLYDDNRVCKVTPIFLAAIAGKASTVNLLLEKKASIAPQGSGEPLLHWILASNEHTKVLEVVLDHCGDPINLFEIAKLNNDNKTGEELTSLLSDNGFVASDVSKSLDHSIWLGKNASLDYLKEQLNDSIAPDVLLGICLGALINEREDLVNYLTNAHGLDIKSPLQSGPFKGCNAAVFAAILGDAKIFPLLKEVGIELNAPVGLGTYQGQTPAYIAAKSGHTEILKFFKDNDYNFLSPMVFGSHAGRTVAVAAAVNGHVEVLKLVKSLDYDFNEPIASGEWEGFTLAYVAATCDQVEVLKYFVEVGVDMYAPNRSGITEGFMPIFGAVKEGKLKAIDYFFEIGVDMRRPIASGKNEGLTVAFIAAENGQIEVLALLKERGINVMAPVDSGAWINNTIELYAAITCEMDLLRWIKENYWEEEVRLSGGSFQRDTLVLSLVRAENPKSFHCLHQIGCPLNAAVVDRSSGKSFTPAYLAAIYKKVDMLNTLQELGVDLDVPVQGIIPSKISGVKKLQPKQRIDIAYRQLKSHQSWFKENQIRFIREMETFPVTDWIQERSIEDILKIYQHYLEVGGTKTRWIADVAVHFANLQTPITEVEIRKLIALFDLSKYCLEDFLEATTPGPVLLALLEVLSQSKKVCENSNQNQLSQWASAVLQNTGGDQEFWEKSQDYFKVMQQLIKEKSITLKRSGKGKGKGKGPQPKDFLEPLWKKFAQKIEKADASENALKKVRDLKRTEFNQTLDQLFKEISDGLHAFRQKFKITGAIEGNESLEVEYVKAKAEKIQAVLNALSEKHTDLVTNLEGIQRGFGEIDLHRFAKVADLQEELNVVVSKMSIDCEKQVKAFKQEIGELEKGLELELRKLRKDHEFKEFRSRKIEESIPDSHSQHFEKIISKELIEEKTIWANRQQLLSAASTIEEVDRIDREANEKWNQLGQSMNAAFLSLLQTSIPSKTTGDQRIAEHNDRKIQKLKREKKELMLEIERVRQAPIRSGSPEKKLPVIEKPVKERLIKKLKKIAFLSENAEKALSMIEQEGKILSRVVDIEKFLALFKIDYQRTNGSHSTYSDGSQNVVIADHTGESKPYQVEEALKAVLDKLSGKK